MPRKNLGNPVVNALSKVLADTYVLYTKTQNYHWNVTGEFFPMLHAFFEEQYEELSEAVDLLAERIRGLGEFAPGTLREFIEISTLHEASDIPTQQTMIKNLYEDHEKIVAELAKFIKLAQENHDEGTADVFIERIRAHEKTAWMLRSSLRSEQSAKVTKFRPKKVHHH